MDDTIPTIQAINERRRANKISQVALYRKAEVSHRTWFENLNSKERSPNITTLIKLNTALDTLIAEQAGM